MYLSAIFQNGEMVELNIETIIKVRISPVHFFEKKNKEKKNIYIYIHRLNAHLSLPFGSNARKRASLYNFLIPMQHTDETVFLCLSDALTFLDVYFRIFAYAQMRL